MTPIRQWSLGFFRTIIIASASFVLILSLITAFVVQRNDAAVDARIQNLEQESQTAALLSTDLARLAAAQRLAMQHLRAYCPDHDADLFTQAVAFDPAMTTTLTGSTGIEQSSAAAPSTTSTTNAVTQASAALSTIFHAPQVAPSPPPSVTIDTSTIGLNAVGPLSRLAFAVARIERDPRLRVGIQSLRRQSNGDNLAATLTIAQVTVTGPLCNAWPERRMQPRTREPVRRAHA